MPPPSPEVRVQAVRWKLGLPTTHDAAQLQAAWAEIARDPAAVKAVTNALSQPLYRALATKLGGEANPKHEWARELSDLFLRWVAANEGTASAKLAGLLTDALNPPAAVLLARPAKPTGLHPDAGRTRPAPTPPTVPEMPPPLPASSPPSPPPPPVGWQCKPIPDAPEPYPEFAALPLADAPAGFRGFGANVRGKKHKHDGTNCDDAFAFARAGDWTVVAVADGAGSKKLSRLGARAAVAAALATLTGDLAGHALTERTTSAEWLAALGRERDGSDFAAADVQAVAASLHQSMRDALTALERVAAELQGRDDIAAFLSRPAEVADLSCTLLLAVTRAIVADGKPYHLVVGCQVGDGLIGTVSRAGSVTQVGAADSGGHAGETDFLTSSGKTEPAFLAKKTAAALTDLQALLVMTDGVADDYFPAGDHLARLWGDLVVNGVPDLEAPTADAVANALSGSPLTAEEAAGFAYEVGTEVVAPDPRPMAYLRSCETFAQRLDTTAAELVKRPAALWAGRKPLEAPTAEARLKLWLDSYHVRGSFDDRTLVVLHREDLS